MGLEEAVCSKHRGGASGTAKLCDVTFRTGTGVSGCLAAGRISRPHDISDYSTSFNSR